MVQNFGNKQVSQDQLAAEIWLAGSTSSIGGLNYHHFKLQNSVGLEDQLQQRSTGLAQISLVEDQQISHSG